jgi:hypothetical protein
MDSDVLDEEAALMDAREEERLRRTAERKRRCGTDDLWAAVLFADAVAAVLTEVCRGV